MGREEGTEGCKGGGGGDLVGMVMTVGRLANVTWRKRLGQGGWGGRRGNRSGRWWQTRRAAAVRRQGWLGIGWHNGGLKAVDGDIVGGGSKLKLKVVGRTAKNMVRTVIERGEGGDMTVMANKDKIGGEKVRRQSGRRLVSRGIVVAGRSGVESRHAMAEGVKKGRGGSVG